MSNTTSKFFYFVSIFLIGEISYSQWQPDVRLTNEPATSQTSYNGRCASSTGSIVHVVWGDYRDGNLELYYKRSTDGGSSWGADTRLTNNISGSFYPSESVSGSVVHVLWEDNRDGNWEIYYKRSTDGGSSWGADTRLTNNTATSTYSSISVSGSSVHIAWEDGRDGPPQIYYKRSTDGGSSWGADTRLTNNGISFYPCISVSGSIVHIVWDDYRNGNDEIYDKCSTDGGSTWGIDTRLTFNNYASYHPSVSLSDSVVHVVWHEDRDGNWEIYYKRSTDGGSNWEADTRLTNNTGSSELPSISVSSSVVHVVWYDNRDGNWEIYYKRSTDGGSNWEADTRLTNNTAFSFNPSLSISGSFLHVVWYDSRDGNFEIYYKRNPTGNPTGIVNINSDIPKEFSLSQNYPNPFNPTTTIKFAIAKSSFTSIKICDILGREVTTLVNEQLNPGTYEIEWDASNYPSGVYFYRLVVTGVDRLTAEEFIAVKKMTLMK